MISRTLSSGVDLGEHALDADLAGDPLGRLLRVAGQQDRRQAERLQLADRLGARRLDRVAHRERRSRRAVPGDDDLAAFAPDDDLAAVDDAGDADAGLVAEAGDGRQLADLGARGAGDRLGDRMLARRLDGAGQAQDIGARVAPFRSATSASSILPSVTVPVLSSTIVSTRRVCSRISGPLIRMPSCAPRPVPTISAVGVARPRAQGQAMIRTATAAVKAVAAEAPKASQPASVSSERTITTGTKIAETRSASRCTGALPDWAASTRRAICASAVSAPTLVARTIEPAIGVDRRAGDVGADRDLDRQRLAGQHRLVDRRLALDDDAVGRDLLAGADDEQVADLELGDGNEHLLAVAQHARLLGAELQQLADRLRGAALGAGLEVAAEHDQRRHDRADLEVGVGGDAADEHDGRPEPGGDRAERDQRVHRRREVARVLQRGAVEPDAGVEDDRRREGEREPLPAGEAQRRHHRQQGDRHGQDDRERQPPREHGQRLVVMVMPAASCAALAGCAP